ncbi:acetyl-CoA acetyltransferase [Rhodopseudomonas rhenobacensis]|uniref:Acetyl-CoA acetyltransferase n=1 Tax=Rhodopseudomonas rhenobacensis TaxID=87461 RepID=A0A7W7Z5E7_9BRAD|nr:thiolase family protein [Rhodopseudomonas rhenobacensis]MBB5048075.1 acetyl-CoA acetyltransferase [Rhodopseudomonas rhenobacensis]
MSDDIYVIGVSMTRFGKFLDRSVKSLVAEAVTGALADAGAALTDIGAAYYANTTQGIIDGQLLVRGQVALRPLGFATIPIVNVENACASGTTALQQAMFALKAGMSDVAIAVGVEKMYDADKVKSNKVFEGGWDVAEVDDLMARLMGIGDGVQVPADAAAVPSPFMELYASLTRGHMKAFGTTQRQIATVSAKNHHHSTMNPLSQYQNDITVDEVLQARGIQWPLTLPMCAPISDGASAVILCRKEALSRFPDARPIRLLSCVLTSGSDRDWTNFERHMCRIAANQAYQQAGVGPNDMSVAEVHDASAFAEIIQTENLGFCELGQGGWIAERGETSLGGRIPVNPSGGLESKGHPIAATGLAQIYELTQQLRGTAGLRQVEGARFGIAENGGGFHGVEEAAACVTILAA